MGESIEDLEPKRIILYNIYLLNQQLFYFRCDKKDFLCRHQLRASFDERVHDAVVPDPVLHVPAAVHGAEGVGPHPPRGQRGPPQDGARHLEGIGRVSDSFNFHAFKSVILAEGFVLEHCLHTLI